MKLIIYALMILPFLCTAQQEKVDTIEVAYTKSSFLIFDSEPKYIPGSEDIIVQQIDNKLIIQAAVADFEETNLMVQVGADYFLFVIRYNDLVKDFFHNYQGMSNVVAQKSDTADTIKVANALVDRSAIVGAAKTKRYEDSVATYFKSRCDSVFATPQDIKTLGVMKYKYLAYVSNMYVDDNYFYIRYGIKNTSNVKFQVDYQSFIIKNKSGSLRKKAYQDLIVSSVHVENQISIIEGKETKEMVIVLDKFTIEKDKVFSIEVWESDGDRRIIVDIDYKHLINIEKLDI